MIWRKIASFDCFFCLTFQHFCITKALFSILWATIFAFATFFVLACSSLKICLTAFFKSSIIFLDSDLIQLSFSQAVNCTKTKLCNNRIVLINCHETEKRLSLENWSIFRYLQRSLECIHKINYDGKKQDQTLQTWCLNSSEHQSGDETIRVHFLNFDQFSLPFKCLTIWPNSRWHSSDLLKLPD